MMTLYQAIPLTLSAILLCGCPGAIDNVALKRILPAALERGDIDEACAMGESLSTVISSLDTKNKQPTIGMTITGIAAAICSVKRAQQADLNEASIRALWMGDPKGLTAVTDARIAKKRAHTAAAMRFGEVWTHFNTLYPNSTERCPKLKPREEVLFLVGALSGLLAVLHDGAGGRRANISQDIVLQAGRAAQCLDNERWWNIPAAMEAGGWASIPGSGPEDIDPWTRLKDLGTTADDQGVRLTTALYVTIAANAGRSEDARTGIQRAAESFQTTQASPEWRLLDRLAHLLIRHESDLIWFAEVGHRTETLGTFPIKESPKSETANPFAEDEDPFGSD